MFEKLWRYIVDLSQIGAFIWIVTHHGGSTGPAPTPTPGPVTRPYVIDPTAWVLLAAAVLYAFAFGIRFVPPIIHRWGERRRQLGPELDRLRQQNAQAIEELGEKDTVIGELRTALNDQRQEIEGLQAQIAQRQAVIQSQRDSALKLLKEKDDLIQRLQKGLDNHDAHVALRKQGDDLIGDGNRLVVKVRSAKHDDVPQLWDQEVLLWVRRVYYFTSQPPLVCASEVVAGLGLEEAIEGRPSDRLREMESMIRTARPEEERERLQMIIGQVLSRLPICLARLPL